MLVLEREVYNNDDIAFFCVYLTFAKPECDNMLQPQLHHGSGCIKLSHSGLANVNIHKRMFYPLINNEFAPLEMLEIRSWEFTSQKALSVSL